MSESPFDLGEYAQRILGVVLIGLFVMVGLYTLCRRRTGRRPPAGQLQNHLRAHSGIASAVRPHR